ncbi:MAG: HNH endonuclease [Phycisphaeraceae bacterium]
MSLSHYLNLLTGVRTGRVGGHEKPHKPALLMAMLSMIESGRLAENRITYDPELFELFSGYFNVVRGDGDALNMLDPFWRLKSDDLLAHQAKPGYEQAIEFQGGAPSVGQLQTMTTFSKLPDELFDLLQDPAACATVRQAIINRYFADKRDLLEHLAAHERAVGARERMLEEADGQTLPDAAEAVRDQAFRRVVLKAYDYRCAACGLRVVVDDLVLVDAAHLIPWNVSRDDDPRNGMTLCKNHHWAMDRSLIAPTPGLKWKISPCLDDRVEGQRDLLGLHDRGILLPRALRFHPKPDALKWRDRQLRSA